MSLPAGWAETTLGEVADFVMGQAPPGHECNTEGQGTPFVKAGEFGPSRPIIREWTTKPLKFATADDVLICVVGATAGKLNLGADCAIGRSVAAISPSTATNSSFLYPRLLAEVARLRKESTGTAQGVISRDMLADIDLDLPPVAEQCRIVAKLDALTARIAGARAELGRVAALAARLRSQANAVAHDASAGAWPECSLEDIADTVTGTTPPTAEKDLYYGGEIPFFKPTDLDAGYHVTSPRETLTAAGATKARVVPAGTTLVTCIGATISKTGLARVPCAFNQQINAAIPIEGRADPRWLYWAITSPRFRNSIIDNASATTMPIINKGRFNQLRLHVPPLEKQIEIADRLESTFTRANRLEAEAARARKLLDRLESAILAKAFRGELVPQDPNDEPASVLLDRIRAARAAAPKAKRGRKAAA